MGGEGGAGGGAGGDGSGELAASSVLIRQWAEKMIGEKFETLSQLSSYLVKKNFVSGPTPLGMAGAANVIKGGHADLGAGRPPPARPRWSRRAAQITGPAGGPVAPAALTAPLSYIMAYRPASMAARQLLIHVPERLPRLAQLPFHGEVVT